MGPHVTGSLPVDGGYPADRDLHQMSDDGSPVGPDPARWSDPEWRDDEVAGGPAVFPDPGVTVVRPPDVVPPSVHYRTRQRGAGIPRGPSGGRPAVPVVTSVRQPLVWMSVRDTGGLTSVWSARRPGDAPGPDVR